MFSYIKLRYTLPPKDESRPQHKPFEYFLQFIDEYVKILEPICISWGYEEKDKCGNPTHPHIHAHFTTDKKVETIRKALARKWKDEGETRTRSALYSLKQEEDVKDESYFFRYTLKQGDERMLTHSVFPLGFDYKTQRLLAMEQYGQIVEVNRKKLETTLDKVTTYDKLAKYLDQFNHNCMKKIVDSSLEFYIDNNMAVNTKTIAGYALTYGLKNNLVQRSVVQQQIFDNLFK